MKPYKTTGSLEFFRDSKKGVMGSLGIARDSKKGLYNGENKDSRDAKKGAMGSLGITI